MDEAQVLAIVADNPEAVALVKRLARDDLPNIATAMGAIEAMSDEGFHLWRFLLRRELGRRVAAQAAGVTS